LRIEHDHALREQVMGARLGPLPHREKASEAERDEDDDDKGGANDLASQLDKFPGARQRLCELVFLEMVTFSGFHL
jgi:hypothetical protein